MKEWRVAIADVAQCNRCRMKGFRKRNSEIFDSAGLEPQTNHVCMVPYSTVENPPEPGSR